MIFFFYTNSEVDNTKGKVVGKVLQKIDFFFNDCPAVGLVESKQTKRAFSLLEWQKYAGSKSLLARKRAPRRKLRIQFKIFAKHGLAAAYRAPGWAHTFRHRIGPGEFNV